MWFLHNNFIFELKHEWWVEAGMQGFVASFLSYPVNPESFPDRRVHQIPIREIAPVLRELSDGVLNNDSARGLIAKDRAIHILQGFLTNAMLPPVEVVALPECSPYRYKLTHGAHRFYLSIAAGFTHIPVVDGCDWSELQPKP
jgi:hypothetical protein